MRLGSLEGVPFIQDASLPDAGIDGIFAAFCRGLDHLLIALRRLVEPALGGEYVGLQVHVDQQSRQGAALLMQPVRLQKPLPGQLHLAQEEMAAAQDARAQTAGAQVAVRHEG